MLAYNNSCYTRIPNCSNQAANTCYACNNMHLWNNACYTKIDNCANQTGSTCASCNAGYSNAGTSCYVKYPGKPYIAAMNRYAWNTGTRYSWDNAKTVCANAGMYVPNLSELSTFYNYKGQAGIAHGWYWSSNELDSGHAYYYDLGANT